MPWDEEAPRREVSVLLHALIQGGTSQGWMEWFLYGCVGIFLLVLPCFLRLCDFPLFLMFLYRPEVVGWMFWYPFLPGGSDEVSSHGSDAMGSTLVVDFSEIRFSVLVNCFIHSCRLVSPNGSGRSTESVWVYFIGCLTYDIVLMSLFFIFFLL